jgi:hypothetical protein
MGAMDSWGNALAFCNLFIAITTELGSPPEPRVEHLQLPQQIIWIIRDEENGLA